MTTRILLSADDRTGALEIGGLLANVDATVAVGPNADDPQLSVIDIATRHLTPAEAQARMQALLSRPAEHRAHKMDAGLRGNWPYEIDVLLDAGHKVAVVCSYPDAGRRCLDGVVYIHDLPVLESVFGQDPLNAAVSSRPAEVLEHAGISGDVVVWDANDNDEMYAAVRQANEQGRTLVGPSGVMGAFAEQFLPGRPSRTIPLPTPCWVLCGSLNPLSREQIASAGAPVQAIDTAADLDAAHVILATPEPAGEIGDEQASEMAARAAALVREHWDHIGTLIVIGGDTAGAIIGDDTLDVLGLVASGIPASDYQGLTLVTKGGGIGQPHSIGDLLARSG